MRKPTGRGAVIAAALAAAAGLLWACGGDDGGGAKKPGGTTAPGPGAASPDSIPDSVLLAAAPEGAKPAGAVKREAKEGDVVVVRGKIGGSDDPFVAGRAVMTIVDPTAVTSCLDMDMGTEKCPTPWDYCCTPVDVLRANTVMVEVDGADGRPLRGTLKGWKGIEALRTVVVQGTVGPRPDPGVLVVRATGIFVEPAKK